MQNTIFSNEKYTKNIIEKIKADWVNKLHILADFDRTMTKAFSWWKLRSSLISVLRSEWYLSEEYSRKAYELFDYYNPIEINPAIPLEEKKEQMTIWWNKHLSLLVDSGIHKRDIENVISSWVIDLRPWIRDFLWVLKEHNIPIIIISANWLWTDSIKMYLEKEWVMSDNIKIISNEFYWDENWNAVWYDERVIHVFNKDETVLKDFVEIHDLIKDRTNVILLWDSLWDPGMIEGFEYENLLKIWFFNEKEEEHLDEYKKAYDVILTWDNDWDFIPKIL
jgi:5'-nucleotidase